MQKPKQLFKRQADFSPLNMFLVKGSLLAGLYFTLRILFRLVPFMHELFIWSKMVMISFLQEASNFSLRLMGFDSKIYGQIVYIEGSAGVRIINACIGWSTMALFAAFIIAYPGSKRSKYGIIPLGLLIIVLANIMRISLMVIISFKSPESLQFYHRYIFNFVLYLVVFMTWFLWVRKFSMK